MNVFKAILTTTTVYIVDFHLKQTMREVSLVVGDYVYNQTFVII